MSIESLHKNNSAEKWSKYGKNVNIYWLEEMDIAHLLWYSFYILCLKFFIKQEKIIRWKNQVPGQKKFF